MNLPATALLVMAGISQSGCMTSAALVTGPVTSFVSAAWHSSETGSDACAIPTAVILMPVGWIKAVGDGFEKDVDYLRDGTYSAPGTKRVRWVFDPWWGFPKGRLGDGNYPAPADAVPPDPVEEGHATRAR